MNSRARGYGLRARLDTCVVAGPKSATQNRRTHRSEIIPMTRLCEGRVAIVTGAGRGIGREHALSLARHGAKVVVNDLGGAIDGSGGDLSPAQQVVAEIEGMGGEAIANGESVADFAGAQRLVQSAIDAFGDLHVVI